MDDHRPALLDANVLVALAWPNHVHHARAHAWLASWERPWATTPITETALVRLSMNPRVVGEPASGAGALALLAALRRHPDHRFIEDATSLAEPSIDLRSLVGHAQVTDLHLVNLCAISDAVLATLDAALGQALRPADRHLLLQLPPN